MDTKVKRDESSQSTDQGVVLGTQQHDATLEALGLRLQLSDPLVQGLLPLPLLPLRLQHVITYVITHVVTSSEMS